MFNQSYAPSHVNHLLPPIFILVLDKNIFLCLYKLMAYSMESGQMLTISNLDEILIQVSVQKFRSINCIIIEIHYLLKNILWNSPYMKASLEGVFSESVY